MKIVYTKHAIEQIKERKIHALWIEETIKLPDITKRSGKKYYVIKTFIHK